MHPPASHPFSCDASWNVAKDETGNGITINVLPCSAAFLLSGLVLGTAFLLVLSLNDLLFKIGIRSDRLCILVSGFLDAFVTAFNLRRTHQGQALHFQEPLHGRNEMMTALCPASAHTYLTMCLGFNP